jgi:hypothetical protein
VKPRVTCIWIPVVELHLPGLSFLEFFIHSRGRVVAAASPPCLFAALLAANLPVAIPLPLSHNLDNVVRHLEQRYTNLDSLRGVARSAAV